jgi:glycosyltransferase involved in cell wall biosynthesis
MNKENNKFLILTPGFARDELDTTCLPFLQNFIIELNLRFPLLEIHILALDYPFFSGTYQWNKNLVYGFNGWGKKGFKRLIKWMRVWTRLKQIGKGTNVIGILSLWCNECALLGNRFSNRNNVTHFCWIQGQDAKKQNKYVSRIKPTGKELIAISDFIQDEFQRNHGVRPGHVVPIGIRADENDYKSEIRDIDILGVGSLIPLKQYHLFVEVVNRVRKKIPGVRAVLSGQGPEENSIKTLISKYGLQNNITVTGELAHVEILRLMTRSKVFLHTSNYEGLGVACIEALYAGCHVISFVQPMHYKINQWIVISTLEQMTDQAVDLLNDQHTLYNSVITFTAGETAQKILQLYGYKDDISS